MAPQLISAPSLGQAAFRRTLLGALEELREVLHARGRLSDRHAALDMVSSLLLAYTLDRLRGDRRLDRDTVLAEAMSGGGHPAIVLREAIGEILGAHLARTAPGAVDRSGFQIALDGRDDPLALRFLEVLSDLAPFLDAWRAPLGGAPPEVFDLLNDVFGQVLADSFSDERQLGQYLTPKEVVTPAVELILADLDSAELEALCSLDAASAFGLVLDPACGVGSFLTATLHALFARARQRHDGPGLQAWLEHATSELVVGVDKSPRMLRLALASLTLFGAPRAQLHARDALETGTVASQPLDALDGRVGLVLTNPPFGAEFPTSELSTYGIAQSVRGRRSPRRVNSELLFLERSLRWLRPGGRLLAVVPDSILSNRGIHARLRTLLGHRASVRAVVSLPKVTFGAAGTHTKTSLLYLIKEPEVRGPAYLAACNSLGYEVVTRQSIRQKVPSGANDLEAVAAEFGDGPAAERPLRGRWVDDVASAPRWDAGFHSSLDPAVRALVDGLAGGAVRLGDLAERITERLDPASLEGETFPYIDITGVDGQALRARPRDVPCNQAPSRARKRVQAGDVLVSTVRPDRGAVGVVPASHPLAVASTGLAVLRPRGIDALLLARLLQTPLVTEQLVRNAIGVAYPAFDEACLPEVVLPVTRADLDDLAQASGALRAARAKADGLRAALDARVAEGARAFLIDLKGPTPPPA